MFGLIVLIIIGICIFVIINVFLYTFQILQVSILIFIILEIMSLWICFGPQLILYYILKLKENIESYSYLYEQYESMQNIIRELEQKNLDTKKLYNEKLKKSVKAPYAIINSQKNTIEELTQLKQDLKMNLRKVKAENDRLKIEIFEAQKQIEKLKKHINELIT